MGVTAGECNMGRSDGSCGWAEARSSLRDILPEIHLDLAAFWKKVEEDLE